MNGQIPQLNIWDDHDVSSLRLYPESTAANYYQIIDGFGSYVNEFMKCDVRRASR
jgi:hypothetical protein